MPGNGAPASGWLAAGAPVIDSHQHVWDVAEHDQPWLASQDELAPLRRRFDVAGLAPLAAAEGVTATVVVQTMHEPWETPELLALAGGGLVAARSRTSRRSMRSRWPRSARTGSCSARTGRCARWRPATARSSRPHAP